LDTVDDYNRIIARPINNLSNLMSRIPNIKWKGVNWNLT
jgi:hypothetical protein